MKWLKLFVYNIVVSVLFFLALGGISVMMFYIGLKTQ